jgi:hypothetical protein
MAAEVRARRSAVTTEASTRQLKGFLDDVVTRIEAELAPKEKAS